MAERPTGALRDDFLIFAPDDVDLARSPLRGALGVETFVLGAFNPGLTRLPNGNLLMMVRVAEALKRPIHDNHVHTPRWTPEGFHLDAYPMDEVNMTDPRQFLITAHASRTMALTSLSWLLPVELSPDGREIVRAHYERAIIPAASYQQLGVEDARISCIDGRYYMTTCSVSPERLCSVLYTSDNGLDYKLEGIVLDHQNKDMLLFEGKVGGQFMALTRPLGDVYFAYPPDSPFICGPSIHLASSPDALHWKPCDVPGLRARKSSKADSKLGGGAPPIRTDSGWLMLYHGVEARGAVGIYRTFWALLDLDDPSKVLRLEDNAPLMTARPELTEPLKEKMYLHDIVFTTGIVETDGGYIVASGEADLACRITHLPAAAFA